MKHRYWILAMIIGFVYGRVSNDDYETQVQENSHWCQMIEDGTWYASQDEYARRCKP